MELMTHTQKEKLDEAAAYNRFKNSEVGAVLKGILDAYRERAIGEIESAGGLQSQIESVRRLQAANQLIRHIESEIEQKIGQIQDVADELGVDLDEMRLREDIYG